MAKWVKNGGQVSEGLPWYLCAVIFVNCDTDTDQIPATLIDCH